MSITQNKIDPSATVEPSKLTRREIDILLTLLEMNGKGKTYAAPGLDELKTKLKTMKP